MPKKGKTIDPLSLGQNHRLYTRCVNPPLFKSSTFIFNTQEEFEEANNPFHTDKTYGRAGTETVKTFESVIAHLDGAHGCIAVSSGMNAITLTLMGTLKNGDHILVTDGAYRCTKRFIEEQLIQYGVTFDYYKPESTANELAKLIKPNTKVLFMESPSSGSYEIHNISELTSFAKAHNLTTIFDNSWATPLFFRPIEHGIDISVQSATKYISGHSDLFLGTISCNKKTFDHIYKVFLNFGTIPSPENCHLALRSIKTLSLRLKQHESSSEQIAQWLQNNNNIAEVTHPKLPNTRHHKNWSIYFDGANGTFSFFFKKKVNKNDAINFINN